MAHLVIVERLNEEAERHDRVAINADRILKVEPAEHGITITLIVGAGTRPADASRYVEIDVAEDLDSFVRRLG